LYETQNVSEKVAEKLIFEVRISHQKLDKKKIFSEQSTLIKKMNKVISKNAFSNFVPNYKSLATIYQIFNDDTPTKSRVLLEDNVAKRLSSEKINEEEMKPVDDIVYRTFIKKFNEEYSSRLLNEQRELLSKYISSFVDNGIELKIFLNEEVARLKKALANSLKMKEVNEDQGMLSRTKEVLKLLEDFKKTKINKTLVEKILKIQNLAKEITS
jgi:ribosomal protein S20